MASGTRVYARDRSKVRIPSDLLDRFDGIMDTVGDRILDSVFRKAGNRKRGKHALQVTDEDLLQTCREVLRETDSWLQGELNQDGTRSVRVRDAS